MPRTNWLKDPDTELRKVLFPEGVMKVSIAELSKKTGIPKSTLYRFREKPTQIQFIYVHRIAKAVGATQEQIWRSIE